MKNQNEQFDDILNQVIIAIIVAIILSTLRYLYNCINPKKLYNFTLENFEKDAEESIKIYYKYCDNPNLKEYQMSLKDKNKVMARKHMSDLYNFNNKLSFIFQRKKIKKNLEKINESLVLYFENSTGGGFESSNIINNEAIEKTRKSSENLLNILKSSRI